MSSCAFFGHRSYPYAPHRDRLKAIIVDLIENHGVSEFYNGLRGDFDRLCADIVYGLMNDYPMIKHIFVLSYHPRRDFVLPRYFTASIYLLEKSVLPKFAIAYTNQAIVEKADFIVSGVALHSGGAWAACEYAHRKKKIIIKFFETN